MLEDLTKGLSEAGQKLAPPAAIMFMGFFLGIFAVVASLYVFANQINAKTK